MAKLSSLKQGYWTILLMDNNKDQFLFSTLFCRIKIEPATSIYVNSPDSAESVGKLESIGRSVFARNQISLKTSVESGHQWLHYQNNTTLQIQSVYISGFPKFMFGAFFLFRICILFHATASTTVSLANTQSLASSSSASPIYRARGGKHYKKGPGGNIKRIGKSGSRYAFVFFGRFSWHGINSHQAGGILDRRGWSHCHHLLNQLWLWDISFLLVAGRGTSFFFFISYLFISIGTSISSLHWTDRRKEGWGSGIMTLIILHTPWDLTLGVTCGKYTQT